jgi:hypothetical protein
MKRQHGSPATKNKNKIEGNIEVIHTLEPANGAETRTTPKCCFRGDSSASTSQPDAPMDNARKEK